MSEQLNDGVRRSAQEQVLLDAAIRDLFEHKIVFNEYLGFTMAQCSSEAVSIQFSMRPELIGHYMHGRLHGGVIATVLDAVGGLAIFWSISENYASESAEQIMMRFKALATIDLRIDYLRPGIGETFTAQSNVVRLGRRIGSTHASLSSDTGKVIATANGSYMVS